MNRSRLSAAFVLTMALTGASAVAGQVPLQNMTPMPLTPLKAQLRSYVVELQDSLVRVESARTLIARSQASKMYGVVRSQARELGRLCRASAAMAETTTQRVSTMRTNDPRGERGLASYRAGLAELTDNMRLCQREDSVTLAANEPDPAKIEEIAANASDAVRQYTQIRDGLLTLLGIDLLVKQRTAPQAN